MDASDPLEVMEKQMSRVRAQYEAQRSRGENTAGILSLLRSFKLTLRSHSAGVNPRVASTNLFVLSVSEAGEVFLGRQDRLVELKGSFFRSLARDAELSLFPGQVLLVEPDFAKRAIEDSLGDTIAEEFSLGRQRDQLASALSRSSDSSREDLLRELKRIESFQADLFFRRAKLSELNQAAAELLGAEVSTDESA